MLGFTIEALLKGLEFGAGNTAEEEGRLTKSLPELVSVACHQFQVPLRKNPSRFILFLHFSIPTPGISKVVRSLEFIQTVAPVMGKSPLVELGVLVGVKVGVTVLVGATVGVIVAVLVRVTAGVTVAVLVGVKVGVLVAVLVGVGV